MTWNVTSDPVDFEEAAEHFARRVPLPKSLWLEMSRRSQRGAFTIAGVAQLDLIAYVHERIAKAIKLGTSFEDFRKEVTASLRRAWLNEDDEPGKPAPTTAAHGARVELIFRNAANGSYNSGRWLQAKHPETMKVRPYWLFDSIGDERRSDICEACDGTVLPADHEWWSTHLPPLHHNCRSGFVTLTEKQAKAEGITKAPPVASAPGFGLEPSRGEWSPKWSDYPKTLAKQSKTAIDAAKKSTKPLPPPKESPRAPSDTSPAPAATPKPAPKKKPAPPKEDPNALVEVEPPKPKPKGTPIPPAPKAAPKASKLDELGEEKFPTEIVVPGGDSEEAYLERVKKQIAKLPPEQRKAIQFFTTEGYHDVRKAEALTTKQLEELGWSSAQYGRIDRARERAKKLAAALAQIPAESATLYRGLSRLDEKAMAHFLESDTIDFASTSSASRSPNIAKKFLDKEKQGDGGAVLFRMKTKTAKPIETLSKYKGEKELLIAPGTRFRVTGRSRAKVKGNDVLVLELEEL